MITEHLLYNLLCSFVYFLLRYIWMFSLPIFHSNGYNIYVDIMTGEKLSSIKDANMELTYWSARYSSRREGDGVKGESLS